MAINGATFMIITTKFHGSTNTLGSRIIVTAKIGQKLTIQYDHALSADQNHDNAAIKLCQKFHWYGKLHCGENGKGGYTYVFDSLANTIEVK